jgi:SAM-dependent methyltransferase
MSFQFNFFSPSNEPESRDSESQVASFASLKSNSCFEWNFDHSEMNRLIHCEKECIDEVEFPHLYKRMYCNVVDDLKRLEKNSDLVSLSPMETSLSGITEASDVVPQQYEGGLKTWECSIDLLHLLKIESDAIKGSGIKRILEVGCGSGLPGIYCYQMCREGIEQIVFQDFNCAVLETVTLPNFLLNASIVEDGTSKLKFYYGDWFGLPSQLEAKSFDLILTSETIYRTESYPALLEIFSHSLSESRDARVILAAKDYYFGLGGSVSQFIKFVESTHQWTVKILKQLTDVGVPRSIIELRRLVV